MLVSSILGLRWGSRGRTAVPIVLNPSRNPGVDAPGSAPELLTSRLVAISVIREPSEFDPAFDPRGFFDPTGRVTPPTRASRSTRAGRPDPTASGAAVEQAMARTSVETRERGRMRATAAANGCRAAPAPGAGTTRRTGR